MRRAKQNPKSKWIERVFNVVIAFLVVVLVISIFLTVMEINENASSSFTGEHMRWSMEDQRYDRIVSSYYDNAAFLTASKSKKKSDTDLKYLA